MQIWETLSAGDRAPEWLPDLAEGIVGRRVDSRGLFDNVPPMGRGRPGGPMQLSGEDAYAVWGRWFMSDRGERTISPSATMTVAEYIDRLIESDLIENQREALHMVPDRPSVLARMADLILDGSAPDDERARSEVLFYGRRAAEVAGDDPMLWLAHAGRAARLEESGEVKTAAKNAVAVAVKLKDEELLLEVRARAEKLKEGD